MMCSDGLKANHPEHGDVEGYIHFEKIKRDSRVILGFCRRWTFWVVFETSLNDGVFLNHSKQDAESPRATSAPYPNPYPAFLQDLGAQALSFYTAFPDTESKSSVVISPKWLWSLTSP